MGTPHIPLGWLTGVLTLPLGAFPSVSYAELGYFIPITRIPRMWSLYQDKLMPLVETILATNFFHTPELSNPPRQGHFPSPGSSPKRWRAAIRDTHAQNFAESKVRVPELLCTCSMAQTTTVMSCNLRVAMYPFRCSSYKGSELQSGVPMSRLSLSQGSAHLSHNIPVQCFKPQRWRVAT